MSRIVLASPESPASPAVPSPAWLAAEVAWHRAIASYAVTQAVRDEARHTLRHSPSTLGLQTPVLVRATALGWPQDAAFLEALATTVAPLYRRPVAWHDVVFDAVERHRGEAIEAHRAAFAAWLALDPAVAHTAWQRPAVRAIGPNNPLTRSVQKALLTAVRDGHCTFADLWPASLHLRQPMELITRCQNLIDNTWRDDEAEMSRLWVPVLQDILMTPEPATKRAHAIWERWRKAAVDLLARRRHSAISAALVERHILQATGPGTTPMTTDELKTLPELRTLDVPALLALLRRVPVPAHADDHCTPLEQLQLRTIAGCLKATRSSGAIWRAVWAAAPTDAQRLALLRAGGFQMLGPWWTDAETAEGLCGALAVMTTPLASPFGAVDVDEILALLAGHVRAGTWLRAHLAHTPESVGVLRDALRYWHAESAHWPLAAADLLPFLTHASPDVRAVALQVSHATTDAATIDAATLADVPTSPARSALRPSLGP